MLRIVRGDATAEEVAAIVAVLGARPGGDDAPPPARRRVGGWSDPRRLARAPLATGPGAWRTSGW